ncbi:MAG: AMP-binding protein [Dehalococcoidia bacterium]
MEEYPWLKHYDKDIPHTLQPYPDKTMIDVVDESAGARPYRAVFFFKGAKLLYDDFIRLSNALAMGLTASGVKSGDRVAMLLPNSPQMVIAFQGIWRAGAIAVPLDPLATEFELRHILKEIDPAAVIVLKPFYNAVKRLQAGTNIKTVIPTSLKEFKPANSAFMHALMQERDKGSRTSLAKGDVYFQDLVRKYKNKGRPHIYIRSSDPAVILFSGGTTGPARGAVGTHQALMITAMQINAWLYPAIYEWDDRVMLSMPMFHAWGLAVALGTAMVNHSSCVLISDPRDWTDIKRSIKKYGPAVMMDIPDFYTNLLEHMRKGSDFKSLRVCISGVDKLPDELSEKFNQATGIRLINHYSLTEAMGAPVMAPVPGIGKERSVGLPLPDVVVKLADKDTGRALGTGELGEVYIKAPNLMLGYWNQPGETMSIMQDGWLRTGDIGYLDDDGYLFLSGRKRDLVKAAGNITENKP